MQEIIRQALDQRLAGQVSVLVANLRWLPIQVGQTIYVLQVYDPVKGPQCSKQLADDVKERVKALGYTRYKVVVQVTLSQRKGQVWQV